MTQAGGLYTLVRPPLVPLPPELSVNCPAKLTTPEIDSCDSVELETEPALSPQSVLATTGPAVDIAPAWQSRLDGSVSARLVMDKNAKAQTHALSLLPMERRAIAKKQTPQGHVRSQKVLPHTGRRQQRGCSRSKQLPLQEFLAGLGGELADALSLPASPTCQRILHVQPEMALRETSPSPAEPQGLQRASASDAAPSQRQAAALILSELCYAK